MIATSSLVVRPYCNLPGGKSDELIKLCLSSLTQKSILYYTFKVVIERKKQSMKTESPASVDEEKQHIMRIEREGRYRPRISFLVFCCSSNVLVC